MDNTYWTMVGLGLMSFLIFAGIALIVFATKVNR